MKVYGIGGLGVDHRVFSRLSLDFEIVPLDWIKPLSNETLESYANRFANQIDTSSSFSIIGVSFGGIVAIELNRIINPEKIILISSASSQADIPWLFRVYGRTGLLRLTPKFLMKPPLFIANWFFGVSEPHHRKLLAQIISDTDSDFLKWATDKITRWDNRQVPKNMIRIHGTSDRLLKFSTDNDVNKVPKAGHFMVVNRARETSKIINEIFENQKST